MSTLTAIGTLAGAIAAILGLVVAWLRQTTTWTVDLQPEHFLHLSTLSYSVVRTGVASHPDMPAVVVDRRYRRYLRDHREIRYPSPESSEYARSAPTVPGWVLVLLTPEDAERFAKEWEADLRHLVSEDEAREARRLRRQIVIAAACLAIGARLRR